jgi:nanoRNase/pAp phosphatase (c-di-AMP/oligoRNAs hydrolase)
VQVAVVCQSRSHAMLLLQALATPPEELSFVVESVALERSLRRLGCQVVRGPLRDRTVYRQVLPADMVVISLRDQRRLRTVLEAVRRERADTPVLVLSIGPLDSLAVKPEDYPWAHFVPVGERFHPSLRTDSRLARAKIRVRQLKEILSDAKNVLVLLQDDPDPDGLACGLALRTLLGRTKLGMPMGSFGAVTRPENLEMMRLLELDVLPVTEDQLAQYDRVVMVDTQPPHLRHPLPHVDVVIDHHPAQTSYEARFKDVRNAYGATATILVEYLRAEGVKVNERLATALLYAVRTDTLLLDRPVIEADVEAFTWLYPRSNINWIRRIERPALPREALDSFAAGLQKARIQDKVIFSHLGRVSREDIIPQLADFCLQVEGVDWSAVSGVYNSELIISVRNVGFVQKAGGIVKSAFGELGSAGGHRSMAKALIPVARLPIESDGSLGDGAYRLIEERFLGALRGPNGG